MGFSRMLAPKREASLSQIQSRELLLKECIKLIKQEIKRRKKHEKQFDWNHNARPEQKVPKGNWRVWLILAGRGFGKTRTGAETIRQWALSGQYKRIALIARSEAEAREVMIEGQSGLLNVHPKSERPIWEPSLRRLTWPNGAIATCYSSENYQQLRGPQFDCAWIDELAKFHTADQVWDQLNFALRLGTHPRIIITTTPRPTALLKDMILNEYSWVHITRGSTYDNQANLSSEFIATMKEQYHNTTLGQQELLGQMIMDEEHALWKRANIHQISNQNLPHLRKIIIGVDPAATSHKKSDETGIVITGIDENGHGYVLKDLSGRYSPNQWAQIAIDAYHQYKADLIIAETNKGGDMVETILKTINPNIRFKGVHASVGKKARAQPVAALYEQNKVSHLEGLEILEDQMCLYVPHQTQKSPDRLDALVWSLSELMLKPRQSHRVWSL